MKTYAYLILAVLICSILIQPLIEVALVCKDRIEIGAAITNSVRAAKKECYSYFAMRDLNAEADQKVFVDTFAQVFAKSLGLRVVSLSGSTMIFESPTGKYNPFRVSCSIKSSEYGDRRGTSIYIESSSDYKFKTKYLRDAQKSLGSGLEVYKLNHERWFDMSVTN